MCSKSSLGPCRQRQKTKQVVKQQRCVVNPQIDLETVKDMYLEKYDVTLKDALDSECGGDFKRLLIELLH